MIARLASARPNMRTRHRAHKLDRRYRIAPHLTTRGNCDSGPTHSRLAHLWSKLQFHLSMLHNGTLHGVNDSYCQGNNQCKKFVILQLFKSWGEQLPPKGNVVCPQRFISGWVTIKSKLARSTPSGVVFVSHKHPCWFITGWVTILLKIARILACCWAIFANDRCCWRRSSRPHETRLRVVSNMGEK